MSLMPFKEDECEPTVESVREPLRKHGSVTVLSEIKQKPNQDVVDMLERMLDYARKGELIGLVTFGTHSANGCCDGQAGDTDFSATCAAFEDWKFRRVWRRNRTDEP